MTLLLMVKTIFVLFSYPLRENRASLSDPQKSVLRDMTHHFTGVRPRMELSMILSGARAPEGRQGVLLNVLEIVGTELLNLVPAQQIEQLICRVALELNLERWGDVIEETLARYRPQAPRRGRAAMGPRAMTVSEEIERQKIVK